MNAEIINITNRQRVSTGAVVLPRLRETYTTTFFCVYGHDLLDANTWTQAVRVVTVVPKIHPETGRSFDHNDCAAFLDQFANRVDSVLATRGDRLSKFVGVVDWIPDGWLFTIVLDTPTWIGLEDVCRMCELPGAPDIVSKAAFVTHAHGYSETLMLLRRVGAVGLNGEAANEQHTD